MRKSVTQLLIAIVTLLALPLNVSASEAACSHQWSEWEIEEEATCGDKGYMSRECSQCYELEYKDIPATGDHDWSDWYTTKKATISKKGTKERYCDTCLKEQTKSIAKLKPFAKLSKKTVKLTVSQKQTLKASYAKGDSVKSWKSSNKKVATVSSKGKITAKKKGTAKIIVTMKSGKKATCTIKVSAKKKSSGSSSKSSSSSGTVYWTPGGSVYHSTKNCPTLSRSKTINSGSVSKCPKSRACKVCY